MPNTEFYVQSGGDDRNAGSTDSNTPLVEYTSGTWVNASRVFTPASGNPSGSGVAVGMFASVYADGATTPSLVGRISAVSTTTITLSTTSVGTNPANGTSNMSLRVGGAQATPNWLMTNVAGTLTNVGGDAVHVNLKGTLTQTAAITRASVSTAVIFEGYTSTIGDGGMCTIQGPTTGASIILLTFSTGRNTTFRNIIWDSNGDSGTSAGIVASDGRNHFENIIIRNMRGDGMQITSAGQTLRNFEIYSCNLSNTAGGAGVKITAQANLRRGVIHDNLGTNTSGIVATGDATIEDLIVDNNGQYGLHVNAGTISVLVERCDFHRNVSHGAYVQNAAQVNFEQCNFVRNSGHGINNAVRQNGTARDCGFFSNTSGEILQTNFTPDIFNKLTYASDPYVAVGTGSNPRGGNFTLTTGSAARGLSRGFMQQSAFYSSVTERYIDNGAAQHQDAGGGGTTIIMGRPGLNGGMQ